MLAKIVHMDHFQSYVSNEFNYKSNNNAQLDNYNGLYKVYLENQKDLVFRRKVGIPYHFHLFISLTVTCSK